MHHLSNTIDTIGHATLPHEPDRTHARSFNKFWRTRQDTPTWLRRTLDALATTYGTPDAPLATDNTLPPVPTRDVTTRDLFTGRQIRKQFGTKYYLGDVATHDPTTNQYRIHYPADNTWEPLTPAKVATLLLPHNHGYHQQPEQPQPDSTPTTRPTRTRKKRQLTNANTMGDVHAPPRTRIARGPGLRTARTATPSKPQIRITRVGTDAPKPRTGAPGPERTGTTHEARHEFSLSGTKATKFAMAARTQAANTRHYDNLPPKRTITPTTLARDIPDPKNKHEAASSPFRDYFHAAEDKETQSLIAKGVWTIETPAHPVKTIKGAFVYKVKELPGGYVEKVKARYVGKGYSQTKGLHYHSSFAPVASAVAVRFIFMLACNNSWPLHHLDVSVAFLNAPIEEGVELYIEPPHTIKLNPGEQLRLRKGTRPCSRLRPMAHPIGENTNHIRIHPQPSRTLSFLAHHRGRHHVHGYRCGRLRHNREH